MVVVLSIVNCNRWFQFSLMQSEVEWIQRRLDDDPTKTQAGIARALNIDKSAVSRRLKGERRLKFNEAGKIAEYLAVDPPLGLREEGEIYVDERTTGVAAIFKCEAAGAGFWSLDRGEFSGAKPRDEELRRMPLAYGVYAPDNSMAPRFKIGELLWINPAMPAGAGDDAIIVKRGAITPIFDFFPCEIRGIDENSIAAYQYGRNDERAFALAEWQAQRIIPRR